MPPAVSVDVVLGGWSHAYAAFGAAEVSARLRPLRLREPGRAQGRHAVPAQPRPAHSFDKFNYYTIKGNAPAGVLIFMFETLAVAVGRRAADDVRPARRGDAGRAGQVVDHVSPQPEGALLQRRPGDRGRREVQLRHADEQAGVAAATRPRSAGVAARRRRRRAHDPLRPEGHDERQRVQRSARLPVFSHKWGIGRRRQAEAVRPDRHRVSDHQRPLHDRARPTPGGASSSSATRTTGRATCGVRRGMFNFDRVVYRYYQDNDVAHRGVQGRRVRLLQGVQRRASGCASTRARSGTTAGSSRTPFPTGFGQGLQSYELNLRRPMFQDIRVREALDPDLRLRETHQPLPASTSAPTACSTTRSSRRRGCRRPGELKLLEPFRDELPPEVFGPAVRRAAHRRRPERAAPQPARRRATLLEEAGWKVDADGVLRNAEGRAVRVRVPRAAARAATAMPRVGAATSSKLGIDAQAAPGRLRALPPRLEEFDFDMVTIVEPDFTLPRGRRPTSRSTAARRPTRRAATTCAASRARRSTTCSTAMDEATTLEELRDAAARSTAS